MPPMPLDVPLYVGIDVAKAALDVASCTADGAAGPLAGHYATDATGLPAVVAACQAHAVTLVVLEPSGGYEAAPSPVLRAVHYGS